MIEDDSTFGTTFVYCDSPGCQSEISVEGGDHCKSWKDVIAEIKEYGWTVTKVDNEWVHLCPACK